jgi:hypothetical protein
MKKVRLGKTNLEVTRWGLGGIPLSTIMGGNTEEVIAQVTNAALDYGINFIDTARVYIDSETNIGEVLKTRRDTYIIASKSINRGRDQVLEDVEESLEQLQIEKIDLCQIHALKPDEVSSVMGSGGALEGLKIAKDKGMIDHIGLTSHHVSVLVDLIKTGEFETVMFPFNVIEREPEKELLSLAKENDIGTLVMKPLAGGAISNIEKAFRFFNGYDVDVILNGVSNLNELNGNLKCAEDETPLTPKELADFEQEVAPLGKEFCRRCSYCMPCTNDILIPDMINVFYQTIQGKRFEDIPVEKQGMGQNLRIWLEACEECGQCEEKCPYNIPIIKRKNEMLKTFPE